MDHVTHPDPQLVAIYLDHRATPAERAAIESHGASCADCRRELLEAGEVLRTVPAQATWGRTLFVVPLAAAAALLLLLPESGRTPVPSFREPAVPSAPGPVPTDPAGDVPTLSQLTWTRVPGADAYEATLFDSTGSVVWSTTVADTVAVLPESVELKVAHDYYWAVRARTGWDRWVPSAFTRFRIRDVPAAP